MPADRHAALKWQIRRRIHTACLADGKPSPFADLFPPCPDCRASGRVCNEYQHDGNWFVEIAPCDRCDGEGFTRSAEAQDPNP